MSLLNELKNDVTGAAVLADWLGNGSAPVCQDTADRRAAICLRGNDGNECPHLTSPEWYEKAKGAVAFAIKQQLEAKSKIDLKTEMDSHKKMCRQCGCCMELKVWAPIEYIAAHTADDLLKKFPGFCWQRIEIENGGLK